MNGLEWIFDNSPIDDPAGHGERAVRALRKLKHPKSTLPGKAFQLDPPFERIVRRIYGPKDAHGQRLVRTVYFQVGKGSRKTSLAAALGLLHTFGPEKIARGENVVAAADRKQARVAFEEALSIVDEQPGLASKARPVDSRNRIIHVPSGSRFEAISSDAPTQHGRTPTFILVDELWAHKKPDLFFALRAGGAKSAGSLLIVATTAGRGNESPDFPIYEYAKKVQSGEIVDPTFLPIIFEASRDDPWDAEATWAKLLPGLKYGYPDLPSLQQWAREAQERPADRAAFEQFYLGIRQDSALSPFVDMRVYDEVKDEPIDLDALEGQPCYLAVDLSSNTDLSVIVAAWPDDDGCTVWPWFFCPKGNLRERQDRTGASYIDWAAKELIAPTDGNVIDFRTIEATIRELYDRFDVREIAFDPYLARQVQPALQDDGFPVVDFRQVPSLMMPALSTLERTILARKLKHGGHPVLRFCFSNAEAERNRQGQLVRLHKPKRWMSIDGAVAAAMAVSRATAGEETSVYDSDAWSDDMAVM